MKRKGKKGFLLTLLCAGMVAAMVSCSNGDDDSGSSPAPTTETYSGTFTVNGVSYSTLNVLSNSTYTMTGNGVESDNGTYQETGSRSVLKENTTYIFRSNRHDGTFEATLSNVTISIQKGSGTLAVSGSGILLGASSSSTSGNTASSTSDSSSSSTSEATSGTGGNAASGTVIGTTSEEDGIPANDDATEASSTSESVNVPSSSNSNSEEP